MPYAAIEDAIKHGADVISLSVGYYDSGSRECLLHDC